MTHGRFIATAAAAAAAVAHGLSRDRACASNTA